MNLAGGAPTDAADAAGAAPAAAAAAGLSRRGVGRNNMYLCLPLQVGAGVSFFFFFFFFFFPRYTVMEVGTVLYFT